jgi:hypothetical protein
VSRSYSSILLITLTPIKIKGLYVAKSVRKAWKNVKPSLHWKWEHFRNDLFVNEHSLWWSLVILVVGKPLVENPSSWLCDFFQKGIITLYNIFF